MLAPLPQLHPLHLLFQDCICLTCYCAGVAILTFGLKWIFSNVVFARFLLSRSLKLSWLHVLTPIGGSWTQWCWYLYSYIYIYTYRKICVMSGLKCTLRGGLFFRSEGSKCLSVIIGRAWASPCVQCRVFFCTINLWYVHITPGMASSAGQIYCVLFLPPVCLLSCPILTPSSNKYVQQWDHTWAMLAVEAGEEGCWDLGQKSHQVHCCNSPPTHCYLTHARLIIFYILRSCHFLVLSRSVVKRCGQGVLSRSVVKRCGQEMLSRGGVKGCGQGVWSRGGVRGCGQGYCRV